MIRAGNRGTGRHEFVGEHIHIPKIYDIARASFSTITYLKKAPH